MGCAARGDLSIVSYDDFVWNDVFPPKLTSIVQPKYAIGHSSAEILLARIAGKHKRPKFQEQPIAERPARGGEESSANSCKRRTWAEACKA